MSSKSDQRSLEMLYESINQFVFLEIEEKFAERAAENIVDQLYEEIDNIKVSEDKAGEFFSTLPLIDIIKNENIFEGSKEEIDAFVKVFDIRIFTDVKKFVHSIVFHVIKFQEPSQLWPEFIESEKTSGFRVTDQNKEKIVQKFKEIIKYVIEYYYNICSRGFSPSKSFKTWYDWREEKLKFEGLRRKLPELEGLI